MNIRRMTIKSLRKALRRLESDPDSPDRRVTRIRGVKYDRAHGWVAPNEPPTRYFEQVAQRDWLNVVKGKKR